jgi:phosphate:Na+ symporter
MGLLAGAAFTAVVHSSAATAAMVIALASQGMLPLTGAIGVILGANIGTCSTAAMAALGARREGARVAAVHLLVKVAGALAMLPFVGGFARIVE